MEAIPIEFLKCVVFLCSKHRRGYDFEGTGFLVRIDSDDGLVAHRYVVTAEHILSGLESEGKNEVYLRLNYTDRPPDPHLKTRISDWHRESRTDVGVLPLPLDGLPPGTDHLDIPVNPFFLRDEVSVPRGLEVGDEVFFTGLFAQRPGAKKNIPIVRIGNIAAMPGEPIELEDGTSMAAYLIEARSLPGMSGSPVFVPFGPMRSMGPYTLVLPQREYYLLGVDLAHWDVEKRGRHGTAASVNMGIAVVAPIGYVVDLLQRKELADMRKEIERKAKGKSFPKKDRAAGEAGDIVQEEFESVRKKVGRKRKRGAEGSSEPGQRTS
jgi:hypothetical protein